MNYAKQIKLDYAIKFSWKMFISSMS